MAVQNSWVSITSRGRWWTWFVGGCGQMWWPETWDSTVQSGRPKLRGGAWTMVGAGGGEPWKFVEVRGSAWTANFVDIRGYTSGRPKSRCLGRPCRTRVVAHYRGGCWMSMWAHVDDHRTLVVGAHHTWMGGSKWALPRFCVHVHNRGSAHFYTSMPTKLFAHRLRLAPSFSKKILPKCLTFWGLHINCKCRRQGEQDQRQTATREL